MPILCNGTLVQDIRLARVEQFDEKSKNYPIRSLVTGVAPRSYTWSCSQWLDQGNEGACVGFSMAHELIARPAVVPNITPKFAREEVYWEAQKIDPWPGGAYPGAAPFYEGTSVLAGIKMLQKLGFVTEYRWAFSIQDLVLAVGYCGPAVLGIPWYEGMFDPYPCGHLHVGGSIAGGHAILCKAVSLKDRTFTLHNSWGKAWGFQGDAKISWDELDRLLHEGGEAVIPVGRMLL